MKTKSGFVTILAGLLFVWALSAPAPSLAQDPPTVKMPQPGVPEILILEGKFVRAAYNNEGYVILGYQPANRSIGGEWMLLEIGLTVFDNTPNFTLTRDALSVETPDGKTIPLATSGEQRAGSGRRDSVTPSTTFRRARTRRAASVSSPTWSRPRCPSTRWK